MTTPTGPGDDYDPTPLSPSQPGCSAARRVIVGQWGTCPEPPTHAALWLEEWTGKQHRVLLCSWHSVKVAPQVEQLRVMNDTDREALRIRRERVAAQTRPSAGP